MKLTPNQNTLVERLAENGHNVWARDRVRQGWTYSIVQVSPISLSMLSRNASVNYDGHYDWLIESGKSLSRYFDG